MHLKGNLALIISPCLLKRRSIQETDTVSWSKGNHFGVEEVAKPNNKETKDAKA
jgi:hypothetical protein